MNMGKIPPLAIEAAALSNAMLHFAEACHTSAATFRRLHEKYGHYMRQIKFRPVQRINKRMRHGKK